MLTYGEEIRMLRAQKGISLRELARQTLLDTAYLSRIERGTIPPPEKREKLQDINRALGLNEEDAQRVLDLADSARRVIPPDIPVTPAIPMFLRTIANKRLSEGEIERLTRYINENY